MSHLISSPPLPMPFALYDGELANSGSGAGVANTVYLVGIENLTPVTLTGIRVKFATVGGTGHYDVGIYNSSGVLLAHAASSNTALTTSAAALTPAFIGGAITLQPGRYWLALWIDNATDTIFKTAGSLNMEVVQSGTNAGPLPANISSLTGLGNATFKPIIIGIIQGGWS